MIDASMPHLPYTSYTNTSYSPGPPSSQPAQNTAVPPYSADMQRGAMIWPVNGSVTTPQPPQHQISDQVSLNIILIILCKVISWQSCNLV